MPPFSQERLEVLVVVVLVVLRAEQDLDDLGVGRRRVGSRRLRRFHRGDVGEAAEAARDVAGGQRLALEHGDDADGVDVALAAR